MTTKKLEEWIDNTLARFLLQKESCEIFAPQLQGFYTIDFLAKSSFVVTDEIPLPDFSDLEKAGLSRLVSIDFNGITYKDTYFVKPQFSDNIHLHFHELVHVLQWAHLGAGEFIRRYSKEVHDYGYEQAPLEKMACDLEKRFSKGSPVFDVETYVRQAI